MTPAGALYEITWDAALSMARASKATNDDLGQAIALTLFKICNGWARDSHNFPLELLETASEVAVAWEKATMIDDPAISGDSSQDGVQLPPVPGGKVRPRRPTVPPDELLGGVSK